MPGATMPALPELNEWANRSRGGLACGEFQCQAPPERWTACRRCGNHYCAEHLQEHTHPEAPPLDKRPSRLLTSREIAGVLMGLVACLLDTRKMDTGVIHARNIMRGLYKFHAASLTGDPYKLNPADHYNASDPVEGAKVHMIQTVGGALLAMSESRQAFLDAFCWVAERDEAWEHMAEQMRGVEEELHEIRSMQDLIKHTSETIGADKAAEERGE